MKRACLLLILLGACAVVPDRPEDLSSRQPRILQLEPTSDQALSLNPTIRLLFSRPVDEQTINGASVALVEGRVDKGLTDDLGKLYKSIDSGEVTSLITGFSLEEEGRTVLVTPFQPLKADALYAVIVTPRVLTPEKVPFSQDPQKGAVPFVGLYRSENNGAIQPVLQNSPRPSRALRSGSATDSLPAGPVASDSHSSETSALDPGTDSGTDPQGGPSVANRAENSVNDKVAINEVYYDAVGSDTDGVLFVELYGTPGLDLSGYQVLFINGDNGLKTDSITLPSGALIQSDGFFLIADSRDGQPTVSRVAGADLIDNFDPQNGPDAVQLLKEGQTVDAVGYGEGIIDIAENGLSSFESIAATDVAGGHSLERSSPGQDTDNNAADFVDRAVPTPGS